MARLDTSATSSQTARNSQTPQHQPPQGMRKSSSNQQATSSRQQQRPLKLQHVDSLLLPMLSNKSTFSQPRSRHLQSSHSQNVPRTSPARRAKQCANYHVGDDDSAQEVTDDDEWKLSSDDDDSSADESTQDFYPSELATRLHFTPKSYARVPANEFRSAHGQTSPSPFALRRPQERPQESPALDDRFSSDNDSDAILHFSPPRSRSPLKKPPTDRPTTPTADQSPARPRLNSPKKFQRMPSTPHRPSLDAFWSAEVVNTWNDEYSPRKTLKTSRIVVHSDSSNEEDSFTLEASPKKSPSKKQIVTDAKAATEAKKAFELSKRSIAEAFLQELDQKITEGEIGRLAGSTGGVKIIWSKKLNSTAGRAHWRREAVKFSKVNNGYHGEEGKRYGTEEKPLAYRHHASIELAEKVIDDETRLLNVLAHEYCHLANFMISGIKDQPHGASFKRWATITSKAFADRSVVVTTKHSYDIKYKFAWICCSSECGVEYARHSRSIDPKKHTCGKCRGRLQQIRPVPRKVGSGSEAQGEGVQSQYQQFVKQQFALVRTQLGPKSPMKDVMKEIGTRYRMTKDAADKANLDGKQSAVFVQSDDDGEAPETPAGVEKEDHVSVDNVARVLDFLTIHDE